MKCNNSDYIHHKKSEKKDLELSFFKITQTKSSHVTLQYLTNLCRYSERYYLTKLHIYLTFGISLFYSIDRINPHITKHEFVSHYEHLILTDYKQPTLSIFISSKILIIFRKSTVSFKFVFQKKSWSKRNRTIFIQELKSRIRQCIIPIA